MASYFARETRLFVVTSRHVLIDEPSGHYPDRIEIELHIDPANLGASTWFSVPLYVDRRAVWRQGCDAGGAIDVAAVELQKSALPDTMAYRTLRRRTCRTWTRPLRLAARFWWWGIRLAFMIRFTICRWSGTLLSRLRSA